MSFCLEIGLNHVTYSCKIKQCNSLKNHVKDEFIKLQDNVKVELLLEFGNYVVLFFEVKMITPPLKKSQSFNKLANFQNKE